MCGVSKCDGCATVPGESSPSTSSHAIRHAQAMLKDVLAMSKRITTYLTYNPYSGSSTAHTEFRSTLISVNYEFCGLIGFLYESNAAVLGFTALLSEDCDVSLSSLTILFSEFCSKVDAETDSESLLGSLSTLKLLHNKLSTFKNRLRHIYPALGGLTSSFETDPYSFNFGNYLSTLCLDEFEIDSRPKHIALLGLELGSPAVRSGMTWVERTVGTDIDNINIPNLGEAQIDVLRLVDTFVGGAILKENQAMKSLHEGIRKELERVQSLRFCIAFLDMDCSKSGSSLFLNALMGRQLFPSDDLPPTAFPCRVLHKPKSQAPTLIINTGYFEGPLRELQRLKITAAMEVYKPPEICLSGLEGEDGDSYFSLYDERSYRSNTTPSLDDPEDARLLFEQSSFGLPNSAEGDECVVNLLGMVNDIIRLCRSFNINIQEAEPSTWPRLTVDFESLHNKKIVGSYECIHLPASTFLKRAVVRRLVDLCAIHLQ
ncbi:hypothetical protein SCHPADRAFT_221110 [Schizopora paradoxa]|uniref:Uncharacterized protein n=1 Tax=Schizopora paradoxa TaxID=27342 RepID=A0A0H2RW49_9AGAM|nr:hypothetical protein SCHPADRAFT_221110 [Schizopora paradoxa]